MLYTDVACQSEGTLLSIFNCSACSSYCST